MPVRVRSMRCHAALASPLLRRIATTNAAGGASMKRSNDTKGTHADDRFFQANRLARLRARLGDAEWRRYGYVLLGSKALAIVMLLMMVTLCSDLFGHRVQAADAALAGNDIVNPINTVWTLVA